MTSASIPATPLQERTEETNAILLTPAKRINQPTIFSSPTLFKENEITVGITKDEYETRRNNLFAKMTNKSALILPSAPAKFMSPDIVYQYRQDPNFAYLTGFREPSTICVLHKENSKKQHFYLFVRQFDPKTITWTGHVAGTETAKEMFGADETYAISKMNKKLKEIFCKCDNLYFDPIPSKLTEQIIQFKDILLYQKIESIINECKIDKIKKCDQIIAKLRLIKSPAEINLMKQSSKIAAISMKEMIQSVTPGIFEDRLAAMFEFGVRMRGAKRLSAPVTISHGQENNILHYLNNDRVIKDDTLGLMDTGCEYFGYSSDITRVFPTNGTYSEAQLTIYNLVLNAQQTCIEKYCVVGGSIKKLDNQSEKLLIESLKQIDIFVNDEYDKNNHIITIDKTRKIPKMWHSGGVHYVSHWIGMDIHDTNSIGHKTKFEAGMCIAIEPGIYLPDHPSIKPKYRNIGIRIEDTILITDGEPEVLTKYCPKNPHRIMELMQSENNLRQTDIWKDAKDGLWSPRTKQQVRGKLMDKMCKLRLWN